MLIGQIKEARNIHNVSSMNTSNTLYAKYFQYFAKPSPGVGEGSGGVSEYGGFEKAA